VGGLIDVEKYGMSILFAADRASARKVSAPLPIQNQRPFILAVPVS
jgi:hypothetical protein